MNKLYIFTLNWDGADRLKKLYPSLINSLKDINYEWLIKDNNSKDDSVDYLNSFNNDRVKVIKYKNNLQNFSQGMNFLFTEAKPDDEDYILLLNNDVIFNDSSSIKNMMSIISKDDEVGIVGARLLYTGTNKLQHAGVVFNSNSHGPIHYRARQVSDANAEKNRLFQVVTGAVLLTKAKYYKQACTDNKSEINGMDENFHWAFDDVDLCLTIHLKLNKKIVYCGQTNIFHEEGASLKKNPANHMFMQHNFSRLISKWLGKCSLDESEYVKNPSFNLYEK